MPEGILIAPSILSADFARLADAIQLAEGGGADLIHVDVMDGHFVPNLTIGPPVVAAIKRVATKPVDVHLMIDNVDDTIGWYLDAGADIISVHAEGTHHLHRVIQRIRSAGVSPAVALNPATPVDVLRDIIADVDMVLLMSVNPGFGGQAFIPRTAAKIRELTALCEQESAHPLIQIDGGITAETAPIVAAAGARCLVAGNAVFGTPDVASAIRAIREAAEI
ncbi:MAG: ribulose-phosphate 3-epimerase [Coriobacteriia bacterium]|nr:ribulose-phosphate 3-epimerase [Coriobacteriia bacterium]